jgi:hypothetical protein
MTEETIVDILKTVLFGKFWGIPNIVWLIGLYFLLHAVIPKLIAQFTHTAESHYYYETGTPNSAEKGWIYFRRGSNIFLSKAIELGLIVWIAIGAATFFIVVLAITANLGSLLPWFSSWMINTYIHPAGAALCLLVYGIGSLVYFHANLDAGKPHDDHFAKMELMRFSVSAVLFFALLLRSGSGLIFATAALLFMSVPIFKEVLKRKPATGTSKLLKPAEDVKETERQPEW